MAQELWSTLSERSLYWFFRRLNPVDFSGAFDYLPCCKPSGRGQAGGSWIGFRQRETDVVEGEPGGDALEDGAKGADHGEDSDHRR